jgi:catechol 2,3-dioxygenase-like lactoylglutathione lyase family enzyme
VAGAQHDLGLTHVALPITDAARSSAFYERFADMEVVHERTDTTTGARVVWLSDLTRPFVIVLIETTVSHTLGGFAHLGVGCASRADVDGRVDAARAAGHAVLGPFDDGPPVGYWTIIADPDGHNLELSHGQDVAFTVTRHDPGASTPA